MILFILFVSGMPILLWIYFCTREICLIGQKERPWHLHLSGNEEMYECGNKSKVGSRFPTGAIT